MYAGAVVTAPVLVYQLYKFVQPALPTRATHYSIRVVVAATLLMIGGVAFGYFVAVPAALQFLTAFAGAYIQASLTADSYLNFIVAYVVGLGILFQLPLLLVFWNWISPMSGKKLLSSERFLILFAFIAAAMITPTPDPANQAMIAVPIILIYQIGVVAVLLMNRKKLAQTKRAEIIREEELVMPPSRLMPAVPAVPVAPRPVQAAIISPVVVKQPAPRRQSMNDIGGIQRTRPAPVRKVAERPAVRLAPPSRTVRISSTRPGVSLDGVSRIFSA
jgi:sec-independent protein translocase protein TatC